MTPPPDISEAAASLVRRLSKTLLSLVATPAAVVTEAGRVVATNGAWEELVGFQPTSSGPPELGPEIGECLRGFDRVESLLHQLGSGSQTGAGVATLLRPLGPSIQGDSRRECVARWREVEAPGLGRKYALVVLAAPETDVSHLVSVINAQRVTIDDLLIRQTLIEERERRLEQGQPHPERRFEWECDLLRIALATRPHRQRRLGRQPSQSARTKWQGESQPRQPALRRSMPIAAQTLSLDSSGPAMTAQPSSRTSVSGFRACRRSSRAGSPSCPLRPAEPHCGNQLDHSR